MQKDVLDTARELLPLITRHRGDTESARRIAQPVVESLRKTRLSRLAIPRELHGLELPTPAALGVYELLAGAEASVGWIVWNNTLPCFWGRFLSPSGRAEIFGNPDWLYASSTRPSGKAVVEDGGYRVSGRWSLVSGCELSEWMALRCMVEENGQPRMLQPGVPEARLVFLRRADVEILDTWHTGGLRGTGSHDVVVNAKFVARAHTCSPMDGSTLDGAIGRVPIVCNMAAGYGAQLLGLGRAAIDALIELSRNKPVVDPGPGLGERPAVLAAIAEHQARIAAAREFLHARVAQLWAEAHVDGVLATTYAAGEVLLVQHAERVAVELTPSPGPVGHRDRPAVEGQDAGRDDVLGLPRVVGVAGVGRGSASPRRGAPSRRG